VASERREGVLSGRKISAIAALIVVLSCADRASAAADFELGRYLATECITCHRSATATSTIPNIFGLTETHLKQVMIAYRAKSLPNAVMQNIAGRLSDDEIASLALYFAKTKRP
jgi:cytochrome c